MDKQEFVEGDWRSSDVIVALVDSVLLAFIRGHPKSKNESEAEFHSRLRAVKRDLFGIPSRRGKPDDKDTPELMKIARKYVASRGGAYFQANWSIGFHNAMPEETSITSIVRQVVEDRTASGEEPYHSIEEKIRNLQQKFVAKRDQLVAVTIGGWDGVHSEMVQLHVDELHETLGSLGIPFEMSSDPERDV